MSSRGLVIPPFIVISGAHDLHEWCENDLDGDISFVASKTGYSNDDLAFDWLKHLIEHTPNTMCGLWPFLIIDELLPEFL